MGKVVWGLVIMASFAFLAVGCDKGELNKTKAELDAAKAEAAKTKADLDVAKAEAAKTKSDLDAVKIEATSAKAKLEADIKAIQEKNAELQKVNDKLANAENVQEGRHRITVKKLFFSGEDFNKSSFGDVLNAYFSVEDITLPEGKQRIFPDPAHDGVPRYTGENSLSVSEHGKELAPTKQISFEIDYSRNSEYILKISESAIIAKTASYTLTKRMSEGLWLLDGKVKIGKSSWIEFSDEKIK